MGKKDLTITEWVQLLRTVRKNRDKIKEREQERRRIITEAHDIGGLSHKFIADVLGDIKRHQVIRIVRQEREKNER